MTITSELLGVEGKNVGGGNYPRVSRYIIASFIGENSKKIVVEFVLYEKLEEL
jgi:hypothetical protein